MASDPRLNLAAYAQINFGPITVSIGSGADACPTSIGQNLFTERSSAVSSALSLPGNIGAFANLQLGQGGGTVGAGLANLAAISDSIRLNGPPTAANPQGLPTSTDPSAGTNFVLGQVGLSSQGISAVAKVDTNVANLANIQAGVVYNQVQSGTFTTAQIPGAFSSFQNAVTLLSNVFVPGASSLPPASQFGSMCGAKQYALDLINLAPKYKFLFVVQMEFSSEFNEVLTSIDPAFVIKQSTRPQVDFEYQDVNMYNFRTKVPMKTMYQPMTMKFYDDDYNNAFQFYATYMKIMSPISNIDIQSQAVDPLDAYDNAGGGMGFEKNPQAIQTGWSSTLGQGYAASLGPFGQIPLTGSDPAAPDIRNVLRRISIFHVYKQGRMMNVYHFYNPKITTMILDDLEMATAGEGSEVSLTFSYDSVYIIPGYNIITGTYNLPDMTDDGIYPFGMAPGAVPASFSSKDGTGRGGLDFGQNNVLANTTTLTSSTIPIPSSVSGFLPTAPSTLSGTNFANLPGAPSATGGGIDTTSSLQGNTPDNLSQITTTATRIYDPVTGPTQNSADNTGGLGNLLGQNANAVNEATAATAAEIATNLAQSVAQQQTQQSAVKAANTTTQGPTTTFTGGGGGFGGGGAGTGGPKENW